MLNRYYLLISTRKSYIQLRFLTLYRVLPFHLNCDQIKAIKAISNSCCKEQFHFKFHFCSFILYYQLINLMYIYCCNLIQIEFKRLSLAKRIIINMRPTNYSCTHRNRTVIFTNVFSKLGQLFFSLLYITQNTIVTELTILPILSLDIESVWWEICPKTSHFFRVFCV